MQSGLGFRTYLVRWLGVRVTVRVRVKVSAV